MQCAQTPFVKRSDSAVLRIHTPGSKLLKTEMKSFKQEHFRAINQEISQRKENQERV